MILNDEHIQPTKVWKQIRKKYKFKLLENLNFKNNELELKKKKLLKWKLFTILKSMGDINNKTRKPTFLLT